MKKRILIFIIAAILITAAVLVYIFYPDYRDDVEYNEKIKVFEEISPDETSEEDNNLDYLQKAKNINSDVCAWITIPDTNIDFPVCQTDDNEFYLTHGLDKSYSYIGLPFLDYRCSNDFSDFNSIIYGHNIKKERMFSPLIHFKTQDFFDSHPIGYLTLSDGVYNINFIACDVVESTSFAYDTIFLSDDDKQKYIDNLRKNAVCIADFKDEDIYDKNLCTLSTCSYEFDNARTILVGYIE